MKAAVFGKMAYTRAHREKVITVEIVLVICVPGSTGARLNSDGII
jgi:hypothetical protein